MFEAMLDEMRLRNFSLKTQKVYLYYNQDFLRWVALKPQSVTEQDIKRYLLEYICAGRSSSTVNLAHNALLFYYNTVMKRRFYSLPFQKREQKVRVVPSKSEIDLLIDAVSYVKHKLVISLLYASGVRCSELISIRVSDVDFDRRLLLVRQGKGKKDRYTILSYSVLGLVSEYLKIRVWKGSFYLFDTPTGHITSATVEKVVANAVSSCGLVKNMTPHCLRHAFATHHMRAGTQIEYIQKMLGHKDIRTTQIYERVDTSDLEGLRSPQDC